MIIDPSLVKMLVEQAIFAPYRQFDPMNTFQFVKWLGKRDIRLGLHDWQTLHHLWQVGILHPVAVRDTRNGGSRIPILSTIPEGRLLQVAEGWGGTVYRDLGVEVPEDAPLRPLEKIHEELRDCLIWHPFQLWEFDYLNRLLQLKYQWSLVLCGPDRHRENRDQMWKAQLEEVRRFGQDERHSSFLRLVALLLAAEPLVHDWIFPTLRMRVDEYHEYWDWREDQAGADLLGVAGLTIAEAVEWHWMLAFAAKSCDPIEN